MRIRRSCSLLAIAALAAACGKEAPKPPAAPPPASTPTTAAEYTVIIKSTWTKATHPFEYPSGRISPE